ncbi:hypothetical protein PJIAN_2219 [Paludibacter jiangxiensis]|uniref:Uncharacterized protein n=1 Tax=Paludibacter jiangxiensis TaxID=681398 RepID=A0A161LUI7_9BACT|nr:hypothetical protein PJIAN_2219 [Paludibacter jiangxiensis]
MPLLPFESFTWANHPVKQNEIIIAGWRSQKGKDMDTRYISCADLQFVRQQESKN